MQCSRQVSVQFKTNFSDQHRFCSTHTIYCPATRPLSKHGAQKISNLSPDYSPTSTPTHIPVYFGVIEIDDPLTL